MRLRETHFKCKGTDKLKVAKWRTIYHANIKYYVAGVAMLIPNRIVFKTKNSSRCKDILNDNKNVKSLRET